MECNELLREMNYELKEAFENVRKDVKSLDKTDKNLAKKCSKNSRNIVILAGISLFVACKFAQKITEIEKKCDKFECKNVTSCDKSECCDDLK